MGPSEANPQRCRREDRAVGRNMLAEARIDSTKQSVTSNRSFREVDRLKDIVYRLCFVIARLVARRFARRANAGLRQQFVGDLLRGFAVHEPCPLSPATRRFLRRSKPAQCAA